MNLIRTLSMSRWGRGLVLLLLVWLMVVLMAAMPMFNSSTPHEDKEMADRLMQAFKDLELLKKQNSELKNLFTDLSLSDIPVDQNKKNQILSAIQQRLIQAESMHPVALDLNIENVHQTDLKVYGDGPSTQYEMTRRRVHTNIKELWNFVGTELAKIKQSLGDDSPDAVRQLNNVLWLGGEHKRSLLSDMEKISEYDGYASWRQKEITSLSELVQKRFRYLQNPADCSKAKKIVCNLNKGCGFGCQLHHVAYCFILAYGSERTLILRSRGWRYHKAGWEEVFQPLSTTCTDSEGASHSTWPGKANTQVITLPIIDSLSPRPPFLPLSVPEDLADRLERIHGDPVVWWIGQVLKYLLRPTKQTQAMLQEGMEKMGFQKPIVGIHVRRTDKVGTEAAFHGLPEYMTHVEEYFKQLELTQTVTRRVYLATDDPKVMEDAKLKYPNYIIIGDSMVSKSAAVSSRYSSSSLQGVIMDIMLLAHSDYLVCTFSSQVCRVAYEIMQTMYIDAADRFRSLDDIYYYGGQGAHFREAVLPHEPIRRGELHLKPGDLIGVAGNHWDGFSKGTNTRTSQLGLFPSFKVRDKMQTARFPTYPQIIEDT